MTAPTMRRIMATALRRLAGFARREAVFCAAALCALVSACFVPPSAVYANYIDWNTLCILFALMGVVSALRSCGVFSTLGGILCRRLHSVRALCAVLVALCFFFSMLITNDVALLTFVPFTIALLAPVTDGDTVMRLVILQTIAANTGSMLTPLGNPQNLYLFQQLGLPLGRFLGIMLPYTALSAALLATGLLLIRRRPQSMGAPKAHAGAERNNTPIAALATSTRLARAVSSDKLRATGITGNSEHTTHNDQPHIVPIADAISGSTAPKDAIHAGTVTKPLRLPPLHHIHWRETGRALPIAARIGIYTALFALCLLAVFRMVPKSTAAAVVCVTLLITDRAVLRTIDYMLLLTFMAFFIFTGNIAQMEPLRAFLERTVGAHEFAAAVIVSQGISNVPATLLLHPFATDSHALLVGVNVGGLGTLVASLASLISYKLYAAHSGRAHPHETQSFPSTGSYLIAFTLYNMVALAAMIALYAVLRAAQITP